MRRVQTEFWQLIRSLDLPDSESPLIGLLDSCLKKSKVSLKFEMLIYAMENKN